MPLFNSRLKLFPGMLKSRWSGPYAVVKAFPYGAVDIQGDSGVPLKVNGQHLKLYLGSRFDHAKSAIMLVPQ